MVNKRLVWCLPLHLKQRLFNQQLFKTSSTCTELLFLCSGVLTASQSQVSKAGHSNAPVVSDRAVGGGSVEDGVFVFGDVAPTGRSRTSIFLRNISIIDSKFHLPSLSVLLTMRHSSGGNLLIRINDNSTPIRTNCDSKWSTTAWKRRLSPFRLYVDSMPLSRRSMCWLMISCLLPNLHFRCGHSFIVVRGGQCESGYCFSCTWIHSSGSLFQIHPPHVCHTKVHKELPKSTKQFNPCWPKWYSRLRPSG